MKHRIHSHRETSHAGLALAVPVGLFGGGMLALAAASGKLGYLVEHLPITPTPNGFTVLVLTLIAGGTWWRLRQVDTPAHEQLELSYRDHEKWPGEPLAGCPWPDADANPWFGGAPFVEVVPPRRVRPFISAEDLHPDPEEINPTILPVRPEGRVRS